MKISVKVKPNAKENKIEEIRRGQFVVKVKAPPIVLHLKIIKGEKNES